MNRDQIEMLLGGIPVPILLIGADQRIAATNDLARGLFGQLIQGRHHATVLRHPVMLEAIDRVLRLGQASDARLNLMQGASELHFRLSASAVPDATYPSAAAALISLEDMTASEQAEQIRRDFVANVSHELRTPLTALLGFIETLQGAARQDPAAQARFLSIMAQEAGRMNRLVSDLLSLSRVEAEERMRPTERVDVVALVQSSILALRALAQGQGVELTLSGDAGPVMVQADPDQIHQVMQNLIENAVKYGGPDKVVSLHLRQEPRDPSLLRPCVVIEVTDQGDGIEAEHLPRLTERFYRVDSHRSREKGGTGLGLAIVKHILARHRGRLRIESEPGKGSRFSIILPIA
jgi:two-component system, OmpR family, phosphate regulon sensor histidine kinase PhoR